MSDSAGHQGGYRDNRKRGERGYPIGPTGTHDTGPYAGCAIGFCPFCGANARRTCQVRGLFDCPDCMYYWYDSRVGKQTRSFDDFFSHS